MEMIKKMWLEIFRKLTAQVNSAKHPAVVLRKVDELGRHLIMGREIYREQIKRLLPAPRPIMFPASSNNVAYPMPPEPPAPKAWHEEPDAVVAFAVLAGAKVGMDPEVVTASGGLNLRHLLKKLYEGVRKTDEPSKLPVGWWRKSNRYFILVDAVERLLGENDHPNLSYLLSDLEVALGLVADNSGKRVGVRPLPVVKLAASSLYGKFGEASVDKTLSVRAGGPTVEEVERMGPGKYRVKLAKGGSKERKKGAKKR